MNQTIQIYKGDSVIIALTDLPKGTTLSYEGGEVTLLEDIKKGHKIAIKDIAAGEDVIKYGYSIGKAKCDIQKGQWIHTHNLGTGLGEILHYDHVKVTGSDLKVTGSDDTFDGYVRENGSVGIRNEIWVINTVGCINKTAELIVKTANAQFKGRCCDGIFTFPHPFGCSQLGEDHQNTQKILANLINHPNAGAVLVLGLGCENNHIKGLKPLIGGQPEGRVAYLECQKCADEVSESLAILEKLIDYASQFKRQPVNVSKLVVGMKCGGSDGFSGITANPLVGAFSDKLIANGGSTVLTEVPEMFGAETILMQRACSRQVFDETVDLINNFKEYYVRHNQVVYENPSPGNKEGGITTLEEKSLGCVQKGGFAPVMDVIPYTGRVTKHGLTLQSAPGNDLVASTAVTAAGCQLVLFTTGRGTPFGAPVPTAKIATNSDIYKLKKHWFDFNAGEIAEGKPISELADQLYRYVIDLASGRVRTQNEVNDFREISIFKDGVVL